MKRKTVGVILLLVLALLLMAAFPAPDARHGRDAPSGARQAQEFVPVTVGGSDGDIPKPHKTPYPECEHPVCVTGGWCICQ